jgi:hypothetical protein
MAVRAQSTKSTSLNQNAKNALATKVAKQKKNEYNALSNHNLQNPPVEKKVVKALQKKKDYSALPKVPNTDHVNPQKLLIDTFYAGYRPLSMKSMKPSLVPSRKKTLFDLGLDDEPMWLYSASGLEAFPEWEGIPYEHYKNLKPFKPPMRNKTKLERAVEKVRAMERQAVEEQKPKTKRGRKRPIHVLKNKK